MGNTSSTVWDLSSAGSLGPYYMSSNLPRSDRLLYMRDMFSRSSRSRRLGNNVTRRERNTEEPKLIPTQFYLEESTFAKLIKNCIVAPRYKGSEVKTDEYRLECPICFYYYPALNYTVCCKQVGISITSKITFKLCGISAFVVVVSSAFRGKEVTSRHLVRFVKLLYLKLYMILKHRATLKRIKKREITLPKKQKNLEPKTRSFLFAPLCLTMELCKRDIICRTILQPQVAPLKKSRMIFPSTREKWKFLYFSKMKDIRKKTLC